MDPAEVGLDQDHQDHGGVGKEALVVNQVLVLFSQQAIPQTLHLFFGHLVVLDVFRDALNQLSVVLGSPLLCNLHH